MLNETQVNDLWNDMLAAEVRSLYFADLGASYTKQKQVITGVSFFLTSGSAATLVTHLPWWGIAALSSAVTAAMLAYSIAVNLDQKAMTMAKLHSGWSQIETDRRRLWHDWFADDAESRLREIEMREQDISQTAVTEAPYKKDLVSKWETFVYEQHNIALAQ